MVSNTVKYKLEIGDEIFTTCGKAAITSLPLHNDTTYVYRYISGGIGRNLRRHIIQDPVYNPSSTVFKCGDTVIYKDSTFEVLENSPTGFKDLPSYQLKNLCNEQYVSAWPGDLSLSRPLDFSSNI